MTPLQLKNQMIQVRSDYFSGQATEKQFNDAAQAYIDALNEFKKTPRGKRLRIPTIGQLARWTF